MGRAYNSSEIVALNGATDVSNVSGAANLLPLAVPKTLFLDIRAALNTAGIPDAQIPAKLEGAAFGADVLVDGVLKHTLYRPGRLEVRAAADQGLIVLGRGVRSST